MPPVSYPINLRQPATHVQVKPGGKVVLRGSFHSKHDGSVVDAATTTWPSGAPGGASVDTGGLIDFEGGGFHVVSRDPATHVVEVVASGDAPACALHAVAAPCLPIRSAHQAHSRLITVGEWTSSLKGGIQVEVVAPPAYAPVTTFADQAMPVLKVAGGVVAGAALLVVAWVAYRKWARSARVQLQRLAHQVREKAAHADPILAGPLAPALEAALRAVKERRVDPKSNEGRRVVEVLEQVNLRLDESAERERAEDERRAADDLVHQVEIALEAAREANELSRSRR